MDYSEFLNDYLDDASGHLSAFDNALLSLESGATDGDIIRGALGSLHTLKGNSGMMGFGSLKEYIHKIEECLKKISDGEIGLDAAIDYLLNSANVIRKALSDIRQNSSCNPDLGEQTRALGSFLVGAGEGPKRQTVDPASYLGARTDTIKVDFKRLDDLLNLVGELVIYKTRLNQIETQIKGHVKSKSLAKELNSGLEFMGKTIAGLQEGIMKARMLPVGNVFKKFPRMVRDLSNAQGKQISLVFQGEDTELDKTVIDEIEEPLLHIIRNAVDHGIETPDVREARGKSSGGEIILSASQESNHVIITVRDDGRGIDAQKVRETAIRKGLVGPEDPIDKDTISSLIFSAGFSTRDEVSDVSGRGIGLDVAGRSIAKLNGQITVESSPDRGAMVTIKLPLSLAIIPALMVEAEGEVYAIPMNAVDESAKVRDEDIHIINNKEVVRFRERVLPVVRLNEFFGLDRGEQKRLYLVVLNRAEKRMALAVDRLRGRQEIVIKPLDDMFCKSKGVAGASILGDGRIALIVDVTSFYDKKEVSRNE